MSTRRSFTPQELGMNPATANDVTIHDTLDIDQIVYRQILATQQSQDDATFAANVEKLACYIPTNKQQLLIERQEEYIVHSKYWMFKHMCNVAMNPTNDPVLREQLGSPYLVEEDVVNYISKFQVIMQILEAIGMTWKVDDFEQEVTKPKKVDPPKTPLFENIYHAEVTEEQTTPEQTYIPTCRMCGDNIDTIKNPGTRHKQFHKLICAKCVTLADIQYTKFKETGELPIWMHKYASEFLKRQKVGVA